MILTLEAMSKNTSEILIYAYEYILIYALE